MKGRTKLNVLLKIKIDIYKYILLKYISLFLYYYFIE